MALAAYWVTSTSIDLAVPFSPIPHQNSFLYERLSRIDALGPFGL